MNYSKKLGLSGFFRTGRNRIFHALTNCFQLSSDCFQSAQYQCFGLRIQSFISYLIFQVAKLVCDVRSGRVNTG